MSRERSASGFIFVPLIPWLSGHGLSPKLLHQCGWVLCLASPSQDYKYLGLRMVYSAVLLDYEPATLSLTRYMFRTGRYPLTGYGKLQSKFARLVAQGRDPNALTLQGMILQRDKGNELEAIAAFRKAVELGRRASEFEWAADCYVSLGRLLANQGQRREALAMFEKAALELDNPEGYYELAMVQGMDKLDDQFRYLIKAAANGIPKAWREMSQLLSSMEHQAAGHLGEYRAKEQAEWRRVCLSETTT